MSGDQLQVGAVFGGRYRIVKRLGQGGMGAVYLANVEGLAGFEKLVALKVAHDHLNAEKSEMELFLAEARLTAMLQHANLGQVYDLGEAQGVHFIAMEYVRGVDLRALMTACAAQEARLPLPIAIAIVARVLEGLDYAHALRDRAGRKLQLVHRDVSPVNVLLSYTGDVKLIDFGIAKAKVARSKTRTGMVRGKLDYMSPEQCRGQELDRRSDLFAAGVMLYELVVGHRPFFHENDLEQMRAIAEGRYTPPRELDPDVPERLEAVVVKALAKDRADRFDSAGDMLAPLEEWMAQNSVRIGARELAAFVTQLCPPPDAMQSRSTGSLEFIDPVETKAAPAVPDASWAIEDMPTVLRERPVPSTVLAVAQPFTDADEAPVVLPRARRKLRGAPSMPPSTVMRPPPTDAVKSPVRGKPKVLRIIALAVVAGLLSGTGVFALAKLAKSSGPSASRSGR